VKNIETSGSAAKIGYINYAFGNVTNGQCAIGDAYADYGMAYTAANSVDGKADTWDADVPRGSFGQLRKLKALHPGLKILWSFGGWTWSGGFTHQAAANPAAFANSCYNLVEDPRWADVFDGIDIDWEYPNSCGLSCDTSCPVTGTVAGTAYAKCGSNWWSYDTPSTITGKMSYAKNQGLGGSFFWELSGDTSNGELVTAMKSGLG
jgi:GH18 family chitinase